MVTRILIVSALIASPAQADEIARTCGVNLLREAGRVGTESRALPDLYIRASRQKDTEFLVRLMSLIYVESSFDKWAVSDRGAIGLMQLTGAALEDAREVCKGLPTISNMNDLHDSYRNVAYGSCYLIRAERGLRTIENQLYDGENSSGMERWKRILIIYNGGYKQLTRYLRGDRITRETSEYVARTVRAAEMCLGKD